MILKRIKIGNIRSYEDSEIIFPKGSVLLSGDIGSGKTSILLAIEFALFGLQPGQKGASLLKIGKDEGYVELEFEVDGKNIIITRNLKRKKTISQEGATINIDGKIEEKAVTEIKNTVLEMLNYPGEFAKKTNLLYRFTVYTPQEQMKEIILEEPETRLNTLRHIFGIDKYKRIKENTSILTSKLRENSRLYQGQITDLDLMKTKINEQKNNLEILEKKIPEIDIEFNRIIDDKIQKEKEIAEVKDNIEEMRKLENEVEKTSILLSTKKDNIVAIEKEINMLKARFESASRDFSQEHYDSLNKAISEKKELLNMLKKDLTESEVKVISIVSKIDELYSLKNKISSLTQCPTCLQEVSHSHKNSILGQTDHEIKQISQTKQTLDQDKNKKQLDIDKIIKDLEDDESNLRRLEAIKIRIKTLQEDHKKLDDLRKNKTSLEGDIQLLTEQIARLKESIFSFKKYQNIMESREKELDLIKSKEREMEIRKAEAVKDIGFSRNLIEELQNDISEKEKIKDKLIHISSLESWLSKDFLDMIAFIERNVLLKLRDQFSKLFGEWFSILVPDVFMVRLDDDFTPLIEQQGYEIDYTYLSGGERTAIALAYRLALNQTINSLMSEIKTKGLVILDEPTDGFSQEQLDKMRDVLGELTVDQLIIVSHDQKIESFVDNIIRLKKTLGISDLAS